jgi:ketosteroid isomerase-like protein
MKLSGAIILLLFVLIFPVLTQDKDMPPAQAELVNAERAFAKLAVERGVRESFIAYFADDGVGFAPHPHKVKERFSNSPASAARPPLTLNWAPIYGDIAQAGDLGWNTGPTLIEDTSPEKKPARHGMFFSVWKKQGDGSWRVALDLGADTPAAVAPLNAPFKTSYRESGKEPIANVNVGEEIAGLLKVEREFLAAAKASGLGQAYRSRLSDDARIHRPGVMPVVGKDALRDWLAGQTMTLSGEPTKVDVSRSGDLGYAYGSYELGGGAAAEGLFRARLEARRREAVAHRDRHSQPASAGNPASGGAVAGGFGDQSPGVLPGATMGRRGGGLSATGQRESERPCRVASVGNKPDLPQTARGCDQKP